MKYYDDSYKMTLIIFGTFRQYSIHLFTTIVISIILRQVNKVHPLANTILASSMSNLFSTQLPTVNQTTSVDISFKNITYSVQVNQESDKQDNKLSLNKQQVNNTILNNVSRLFKAGEMTAIIGVSGCGKTSLFNIKACRIDTMQGQLLANGKPYK